MVGDSHRLPVLSPAQSDDTRRGCGIYPTIRPDVGGRAPFPLVIRWLHPGAYHPPTAAYHRCIRLDAVVRSATGGGVCLFPGGLACGAAQRTVSPARGG